MRLAAKESAGYFPTPPSIVEILKTYLRPSGTNHNLLDPCCGTGAALAKLAKSLPKSATYGNELEQKRADKARKRLAVATCGPTEFLQVDGLFSMILLNPPYTEGDSGERQEIEFLEMATPWLCEGGLLIYIVPEHLLKEYTASKYLGDWYTGIQVRRFPQPEYERFKQVVVLAVKRGEKDRYSRSVDYEISRLAESGDIPDLIPNEFSFSIPVTPQIAKFEVSMPELSQALEEAEEYGVMASERWRMVMGGEHGIDGFRPLMPMKAGHVALLAAAGFVDGCRIGDALLKGYTLRYTETRQEKKGNVTLEIETQKQAACIAALNMQSGEVKVYDSREPVEYNEFLRQNVDEIARSVQERYQPFYEMDLNGWQEFIPTIRAPGELPGHSGNGLLPAQQHVAAALGQRLRNREKAVGIVGECGCGKTLVSMSVKVLVNAYVLQACKTKKVKVVVLCPSHLPKKWKREVERAGKEYDAKGHICMNVLDVDMAMEEPGLSFLILSEQKAKNKNRWEHCYNIKRKLVKWEEKKVEYEKDKYYSRPVTKIVQHREIMSLVACPDCGSVMVDDDKRPVSEGVFESSNKKQKCLECGTALWQEIPFKKGGRVALAEYVSQRHGGDYHLIVDECHQHKGGDSDRGQAMQDLASNARTVLVMTGTLYGGRASSLFYIAYRTLPAFRLLYGYDEVRKFVDDYGLMEKITKAESLDTWHSTYGYTKRSVRTRELPGAHPGIVALLLPNFAFLSLADLGVELPTYEELRLPVPMSAALEIGYGYIENFGEEAKRKAAGGNMAYLAAYLQCALGWVDYPEEETFELPDQIIRVPQIYPDEDGLYPKDRVLLELVKSELAQGRRCGIYFSQVNRRDCMPRVQSILQQHGIDARILRRSVSPIEREDWYRKNIKNGMQVMLCNLRLMETGVDLIELPTLIVYQVEYSLYSLRQATRRSWRLGQVLPVRVVYLFYLETLQENALRLVAAKLRAANMINGEVVEGLASFGQIPNIHDELMKQVSEGGHIVRDWEINAIEIPHVVEKVIPMPFVVAKKQFDPKAFQQLGLGI